MSGPQLRIRRIPYPYRAMLAVCSDLDETPDRTAYWEIARFLNTTDATSMGPGAGLEIGNSIYFDMPPGQFAYWNTDDAGREMVRALIRSGHLDCLHSYGDGAETRAHAARALEELDKHDCRLKVWVDHAAAATNFGSDIMAGFGDVAGHPAYHADLTADYGIRYIWRGRVTSLTCQDVPPRLTEIWNAGHPLASVRTLAKETAKRLLARGGYEKYALHLPNRILSPVSLRDGRPAYEFLRANPHWQGVSRGDTAAGLDQVLTDRTLNKLIDRQAVTVVYTHLGKHLADPPGIGRAAVAAFRRVAQRAQDRQILVTTTARLLKYLTVLDHLEYHSEITGRVLRITLRGVYDPVMGATPPSGDDLNGISFELNRTEQVEMRLADGREVPCELYHRDQQTFAVIPWKPLVFPRL